MVMASIAQVPDGFEKVARDMSKGSSRSSYLCFKRSRAGKGDERVEGGEEEVELPISEVVIAYEDEDAGKLSDMLRHLTVCFSSTSFWPLLCLFFISIVCVDSSASFLNCADHDIICMCMSIGEGFTRMSKPLCKGDNPLHLCYKRATSEAVADSQPWSPTALKVRAPVSFLFMDNGT